MTNVAATIKAVSDVRFYVLALTCLRRLGGLSEGSNLDGNRRNKGRAYLRFIATKSIDRGQPS